MLRYSINALALEKPTVRSSHHAKSRIARLIQFAAKTKLSAIAVPAVAARRAIGVDDGCLNHKVTAKLARYLPELSAIIPQKRKFYEPEDDRSCIFRAAG